MGKDPYLRAFYTVKSPKEFAEVLDGPPIWRFTQPITLQKLDYAVTSYYRVAFSCFLRVCDQTPVILPDDFVYDEDSPFVGLKALADWCRRLP